MPERGPDDPVTAVEPTPAPAVARPAHEDLERTQLRRVVAAPSDGEPLSRIRLTIVEGPGAGRSRETAAQSCSIGSHELNDLVIEEPTVSRFHCEIRVEGPSAVLYDSKSRNGTFVDGVQVREAVLRSGSILRLGPAAVRVEVAAGDERIAAPRAPRTVRFGALVGTSPAMRIAIAQLEKAAGSDVTLLLEGETGTGKGRAAEAVHRAGGRSQNPLIVVDCSAIPANLLESELFGHEKGSFTGADARRIGAFEEASGGTLFLDEIGELPSDLQPKLLRALENREVRRIGANRFIPVNLRVIAATNRDLRAEVNAARFRSDLYFRLAVVKIHMPSLRERPDDIPALVEELLKQIQAPSDAAERLLRPHFLAQLSSGAWPGNIRELRNHLERCLVFEDDSELHEVSYAPAPPVAEQGELLPYTEARKRAQDVFERQYLTLLLQKHGGKVAQAAEAAGVDRVYLYRLLRRQGMKTKE